MIVTLCILLVFFYTSVATADTISPRAFLGCAQVLQSRIHCYGGATSGPSPSGSYGNPSSDHFYMDLQNFNFNNVSSGANNWTMVTGAQNENLLVANSYHLTATIMNKSKFIMYGGLGPGDQNTLLDDPFWVYDPTNNSWAKLPGYQQYTVQGAMVDIGAIQSVWTYGGKINNTNWFAQNQKFVYNYGVNKWNIDNADPVNQQIRLSYTATLGNDGVIYMLGGLEVLGLTNDRAPSPIDMQTNTGWYDTKALTWGIDRNIIVTNGQRISSRTYHTATLVPGTSSFLVYGGNLFSNDNNQVPSDYAYMYDYARKVYTPINFPNNTGAGRRSGHATVLYNTDIFIMFGYNEKFQLLNDIHVLDVSNSTDLKWRISTNSDGSIAEPSPAANTTQSSNNTDPAPTLSSGAIAGIAIGAAIVLVGVGGAALFFFYRKRRQQKQFQIDDPRLHPTANEYMLPTTFPDHQTVSSSNDNQTKVDQFNTNSTARLKPTTNEREAAIKPHGDE